jgi:2,4-dienoyl-CoA reductase (NADPH2)
MKKLGVKVKLGREFTPTMLSVIKPDVIFLAVGGTPVLPKIPGIERRNVISSAALHHQLKFYLRFFSPIFLRWLTLFWMPIGKKVVVIGNTIAACEVAEFLTKRGRKVILIDEADELGLGLIPERKNRLFWWFRKKGVEMYTQVKFKKINNKGITLITHEGKELILEADTIIPALPVITNSALLEILQGKGATVYAVGDCRDPALIPEAVASSWKIARSL